MNIIKKTTAIIITLVILSTCTFGAVEDTKELELLNKYESMEYIIDFILDNFKSEVIGKDINKEELLNGAYRGIFDKLDEHSVYFTKDELEDFISSADGKFGGIGLSVTKEDRYIKVITPIEGTPGDKADIRSGDLIIKVDGKDIVDFSLHEAVDMMRGKPETNVTITINRNGKKFDIEITRAIIKIDAVESKVMDNNIGYLRIIQFGESSYEETKEALNSLNEKNIDSLVIDLRNNPGGYLDEVVDIADLFIDKGKDIVHVDYKASNDKNYISRKEDLFPKKIVVLVNEGSASASEILTGAIKDNDEGEIVGTKTYGKGTVQTLIKLQNGDGMKVTVAEYMTANWSHINKKGINPDFVIKNRDYDEIELEKEHLAPMNEKRNIYFGEVSLNVYGLQQRLNILGKNISADGSFGPATLKALNEFQKDNNITMTKYINQYTIDKLNDKIDKNEINLVDLQLNKALEILE